MAHRHDIWWWKHRRPIRHPPEAERENERTILIIWNLHHKPNTVVSYDNCLIGHVNVQVAFSLFSYTYQSACSFLDWVLNNQSDFDRVFYTHYTSLGISITIDDDTNVNMPYCLMEQILFFSPWIQLLPSLRYEWITVRWEYQSGLSPHRYEQTALGKTVAIFNDLITPALTNSNPPFHSIHPNQSICPESLLQIKEIITTFYYKKSMR